MTVSSEILPNFLIISTTCLGFGTLLLSDCIVVPSVGNYFVLIESLHVVFRMTFTKFIVLLRMSPVSYYRLADISHGPL